MRASKISLDEAKPNKLFYLVGMVFIVRRSDNRCLVLRRDEREKVHPGKYGVTGGKLEWGDLDLNHPTRMNGDVIDFENALEELVAREAREEAGVEIEPGLKYMKNMAFVRPDGIPVVLIEFAGCYKSGEIILEEGAFTDFAWVNAQEAKSYDFIDGIGKSIDTAIQLIGAPTRIRT